MAIYRGNEQVVELRDTITALQRELLQAREVLAALLANYDEERQAIDCSAEHWCPECTLGTTPNHLNKGPCAYHKARAALKEGR